MDFYLVVLEKMPTFAPEILFSRGIMTIRKIISAMFVLPLMVACSSDDEILNPSENTTPSTEVFIQGGIVEAVHTSNMVSAGTRADSYTDSQYGVYTKWPYVSSEGWETARFSIRADGNYKVGVNDQSSALYFGRSAGKMGRNRGAVYTMYPYGRYNDRDLDYYQRDKKTGNNIGLFRYVLDETGMRTQVAIVDAPLVVDILADEKEDLEAAIAKGQNVTKNQKALDQVNELLAKGSDYLESHVLWYVVKEVGMRYGWHVNGVISETPVPKIDRSTIGADVPNNVEIDIHQQKHEDWSEIKTSVHVRADVESIKINIPISEDNILEQDDFAIRVYDYYYKEYVIKHTVTHDANGITIEITDIPASLIEQLKTTFGDGLTIEIHSYCKREDEVWDDLKNSAVISMGKACDLKGQITSALKEGELVPITLKE